jgi:hypothetical protein
MKYVLAFLFLLAPISARATQTENGRAARMEGVIHGE